MTRHLNIIDMIEGASSITSSTLTKKVSRQMKMSSEPFDVGDRYLCTSAIIPTMTPAIITDMINCSWLNRSLDEDMCNLNRNLTVINFCCPLTNALDYKHYQNMNSRIAYTQREQKLGHDVHYSKPKLLTR